MGLQYEELFRKPGACRTRESAAATGSYIRGITRGRLSMQCTEINYLLVYLLLIPEELLYYNVIGDGCAKHSISGAPKTSEIGSNQRKAHARFLQVLELVY